LAYRGPYTPKNPSKYIGDPAKIIYRSLKERSIMKYFDSAPKVLKWNSEGIIIPYLYEIDHKMHRYVMDFYAEIRCNDGVIRRYLFEYKPKSKLTPPKEPNPKSRSRKKMARYIAEKLDYIKNANKWEYTAEYAKKNNVLFYVIHEENVEGMNYFKSL